MQSVIVNVPKTVALYNNSMFKECPKHLENKTLWTEKAYEYMYWSALYVYKLFMIFIYLFIRMMNFFQRLYF